MKLSDLVKALSDPSVYPHDTEDQVHVIETHISWIFLTGKYAYKIKKSVNFGFLDFTSLAKRKQYCEAELSLNARSAPGIYVEVVGIHMGDQGIAFSSVAQLKQEQVFEYAIKMNQFERRSLFSELQEDEALTYEHIDELAEHVADFHQRVRVSQDSDPFGQPEQVYAPMQQNFDQIRQLLIDFGRQDDQECMTQIEQLEAWTRSSYQRLRPEILGRHRDGFVRECHGDMHLGNITLYQNKVTLFDCIEFNDDFRWIDVISDVAFLVMDLHDHGVPQFANRFLNQYLEDTGDYAGLKLLGFYKAYRAVVRAKVALLMILSQPEKKSELMAQYESYIDLAESCSGLPNRFILTMHGVSGTGKSTVSLRLVDELGAIRIRSDSERKRLFGLDEHEHPDEVLAKEVYSDTATHQTYEQVARLCSDVLDAGLSVIVDATNLKYWQRQEIQNVGDGRGVPVCIAYCEASLSVIKEWLQKRAREDVDISDADLSVVEMQLVRRDALNEEELKQSFVIHSDILEETNELVSQIQKRFL